MRALLGDRVVDVELQQSNTSDAERPERRLGRDPLDAFTEYLDELGIEDERLTSLFVQLLEDDAQAAT